MDQDDAIKKLARASEVFSPSAPIDDASLFAGRTVQIDQVVTTLFQRGQHVILFGERGVGKTSFANTVSALMERSGLKSIDSGKINCDAGDTFTSLWRKIFREMSIEMQTVGIGFKPDNLQQRFSLEGMLPEVNVSPDDVRYVLSRINRKNVLIIDEIDRIQDKKTTTLIADTVKTLSDHSIDTTLILVGVADSVDELIAEHGSIERALVQVHMPRMSIEELFEIIDKSLSKIELIIDPSAKRRIAWLSQGLPHYVHLISLHAANNVIREGRSHITMNNVDAAIDSAVDKAQRSILSAYDAATTSPRKETLYAKVLLACALAPTDDLGFFAAADLKDPMLRIMGKPMEIPSFSRHLNDFSEEARGPILQKKGTSRKFRFRFINPMMKPFVVLHGLSRNLVPKTLLDDDTYFKFR